MELNAEYESKWDMKMSNDDVEKIQGKLSLLEEMVEYMNVMRQSYTRLLMINGVAESGERSVLAPEISVPRTSA
jgi:hypothetical protein